MKKTEEQFAELERRVRALLADNARLSGRVRELEGEIAGLRRDAQDLQRLQGSRTHIREKIERALSALEAAERE